MKRMMKSGALLTFVLFTATACPRNVQVESEPNQPNYMQSASVAPAEIDMVGTYEYVVTMSDGDIRGPMTVTRAADGTYAVRFVMQDGTVVPTRNVVRNGAELTMDASTPGGPGTVTLEWQDADTVEGEVFIGEFLDLRATRRP